MKSPLIVVSVLAVLLYGGGAAFSLEEYKTEDEEARAYNVTRVVKTVDGLHFSVQEDRPIEKIAGVYRPIDMDSYVAMKFNQLDMKLLQVFQHLSAKIDRLTVRAEALEKKVQDLEQKTAAPAAEEKSAEPAAEPPAPAP